MVKSVASGSRDALLVLLGLLGLLVLPGPAGAANSLADAIKQEDAEYLNAPDVTPKDDAPKIEAGNGEEGSVPKPQEISRGAVKAALSYTEAKSLNDEASSVSGGGGNGGNGGTSTVTRLFENVTVSSVSTRNPASMRSSRR